jgi:hypothetical protein
MTLKIDVSNPEKVAAKMPELRALYEEKLDAQKALNEEVELLRQLLGHAVAVARGRFQATRREEKSTVQPRRRRTAPAQDRAVQALEQASQALGGTAVGPTSLYKFMIERGMEVPKSPGVLGTNLWDAWNAGRVMRAPNGVYTPLDGSGKTAWDRPLTDYHYAAEQGFPIPGGSPPHG